MICIYSTIVYIDSLVPRKLILVSEVSILVVVAEVVVKLWPEDGEVVVKVQKVLRV